MNESEGVIKYQLEHIDKAISYDPALIAELNAWRTILLKLELIGQDPARYQGLGFGNISYRIGSQQRFLITGTQTGHYQQLSNDHYSLVLGVDLKNNRIHSEGLCRPSSEALTHASVYQNQADCHCILHIHNPDIWQHSQQLGLLQTAANTPYGTPEMAQEVADLLHTGALADQQIFTMAGHQDGVVAFAATVEQAGQILIQYLARALAL